MIFIGIKILNLQKAECKHLRYFFVFLAWAIHAESENINELKAGNKIFTVHFQTKIIVQNIFDNERKTNDVSGKNFILFWVHNPAMCIENLKEGNNIFMIHFSKKTIFKIFW